ncbi:Na+/H+ antiporter NhaC family protein [Helicobacter sp.]|uniref:Na+/H+ antiporter NhaC family protein n=1 Tax=Helicobacter sp. TaxID=218 RepID=UPI0025B97C00|nr:Na+/H+ antiporter NhaC family protein [Helicobacter sp.]MCI5969270.1 Na+/H+ antiporter NhaC family protein [Helicobacter sp.]MDY2585525.1 Na+/H+ antiporter NhaC family protein [Helicobacter sp.]
MYADSALSLVVPIIVIVLVFITKRVVLSLFIGIVVAGVMLKDSLFEIINYVFSTISSVFYSDGEVEVSAIYVFGFLILLGVLTELLKCSGGIAAFVAWARQKVNNPRSSEFLAFIAGIVIFIDDYFNALSVGQIARPLNDANHSSRERLAYIIDSTSAPICILMPISSWGAYILGIMGGVFGADKSFSILANSIVGNFYAWFALLGVFLTILWRINLPQMVQYQNVGVQEFEEIKEHSGGSVWLLLLPLGALFVFVGFFIFYSGYRVVGTFDLIAMLSEAQTGFALFWGGACALFVAVVLAFNRILANEYWLILKDGFLLMLPANLILIFAWAIGPVIKGDLQTGVYLANLSKELLSDGALSAHIVIPIILFVASSFIAFCTGTSWGTFAIMLPIGAGIALSNDVSLNLAVCAVLSGAVYGDHASPISDTTILSATGAGCSVHSHFVTQFPYVTSVAFIALLSFGIAGYFDNLLAGYVFGIPALIALFWLYKRIFKGNVLSV